MLRTLLFVWLTFASIVPPHIYFPFVVAPPCIYSSRILYSSSGSDNWVGRSNLLALTDGTWIHVYRSAPSHFNSTGKLHIRFSSDQGDNWTDENVNLAGSAVRGFPVAGHGDGNDATEGVLILAPNGDLLLFVREELLWAAGGTYIWRSVDNGATWLDEGKIKSDNTLLMGGQAVIIGTEIYASFWVDALADMNPPFKSILYKSVDNGATWLYVSDITSTIEQTNETGLVYLGDSTLLVVLRDDKVAKTYLRRSSDFGQTWDALEDVTATFGILQRPKFRMVGNRLYLHGRQRTGSETNGSVAYWFSDDAGKVWQGPNYIMPNIVADVGYGDILPRSSGALYSVHYEGDSPYDTDIVKCVLGVQK